MVCDASKVIWVVVVVIWVSLLGLRWWWVMGLRWVLGFRVGLEFSFLLFCRFGFLSQLCHVFHMAPRVKYVQQLDEH